MINLHDFQIMSIEEKRNWETSHSSFIRLNSNATYEQCRAYACESISNGLTKISIQKGEVIEIPYGMPFHFIGRVDTSRSRNTPNGYYRSFANRSFISSSTICNQNVSHYRGNIFFCYNIYPKDIVHIFPMDSFTRIDAILEEKLTILPSLWLSLFDLDMLSIEMECYSQITVKTKRKGQIITPFAVVAFDETNDEIQDIANRFEIGTIIVHPDEHAINYTEDLLYDIDKLQSISKITKKKYDFTVTELYFAD